MVNLEVIYTNIKSLSHCGLNGLCVFIHQINVNLWFTADTETDTASAI